MWLSGANAVTGSARSGAAAEGRRQAAIITTITAKQITDFWSGTLDSIVAKEKEEKTSLIGAPQLAWHCTPQLSYDLVGYLAFVLDLHARTHPHPR